MFKTALFTIFLSGVILLSLFSACTAQTKNTAAEKAVDVFALNKKIGRGVNVIGYDRDLWLSHEDGRFKARYFRMLKEAGFDSVRINLHPFHSMETESPYTINDSWLATLDWAVEKALKADLTVILDMHEYNAVGSDPAGTKDKFLAFWQQIAPRFQTAPDTVIFEILNEPCKELTVELWNPYYRQALAIIRQTNPTRAVIIGPARYNSVNALDTLTLPDEDRNIIVTVHYYKPMEFTHQGARWTPQYTETTGVKWPRTDEDRQAVVDDFNRVHDWAAGQNRPMFVGEFGAYDKGDMDSRARYTSFVARTAEQCGFSWAYWQFDSDFVLYDIDKEQWVEPIRDALIPKSK